MKSWKIFLAIGLVVFFIGLGVLIAGLAFNGWEFNVDYEMQTYNSTEENTVLDLNLAAGEMYVGFYDGESIEVEYPTSYRYGYEVKEKNGKLTVEPKQHFGIWFGFGWNRVPAIVVRIPRGKVMQLDIDISAGKIEVADGEFTSVRADMSAGWTNLGNLKCGKFVSHISAGKLDLESLECTDFDLRLSAGSASIDSVKTDKITVDLSAGSANLTVNGKKSDYYITVDKSAGSCNVSGQQGTVVGKVIDIDLSAGSVNVQFSD
ncbi:MAG: DUF4097 domain-containing protein [Clostridia bacterium]|nr:DUF4097 domain-containing protein [Clostridia bacterium]